MRQIIYHKWAAFSFMKANFFSALGWTIIFSFSFYFIHNNVFPYFSASNPTYTPSFQPFIPFLIVHIIGGTVALLIGPIQFFAVVRKHYPQLHRKIGMVYLGSILLSGLSALYLIFFDNFLVKGEFTFGTGILGLDLAWFTTAGMAIWAIRRRDFVQHQEWMIRNYVVTSSFITFRIIFYVLLGIESFPFKDQIGDTAAWAGWSIPLLIAEGVIQGKKIKAKPQKKEREYQAV